MKANNESSSSRSEKEQSKEEKCWPKHKHFTNPQLPVHLSLFIYLCDYDEEDVSGTFEHTTRKGGWCAVRGILLSSMAKYVIVGGPEVRMRKFLLDRLFLSFFLPISRSQLFLRLTNRQREKWAIYYDFPAFRHSPTSPCLALSDDELSKCFLAYRFLIIFPKHYPLSLIKEVKHNFPLFLLDFLDHFRSSSTVNDMRHMKIVKFQTSNSILGNRQFFELNND